MHGSLGFAKIRSISNPKWSLNPGDLQSTRKLFISFSSSLVTNMIVARDLVPLDAISIIIR